MRPIRPAIADCGARSNASTARNLWWSAGATRRRTFLGSLLLGPPPERLAGSVDKIWRLEPAPRVGLGGASHCRKAQVIDPIWLLNFAAERYWVQNAMTQILAIVWVPSWFHTYSILFPRRAQYVECTQYMATRTAILNVGIGLNQCFEEIAKTEAPPNGYSHSFRLVGGYCDADLLRIGRSQPNVHPGLRRILCPRFRLRIPARSVAVRIA